MENTDNKHNVEGGSKWGMKSMGVCGCGSGWGMHYILRRILSAVLFIIIFWAGFHLGEIVGSIHGSYGRTGMMSRHNAMMNDDYSGDMGTAAGVAPLPTQ